MFQLANCGYVVHSLGNNSLPCHSTTQVIQESRNEAGTSLFEIGYFNISVFQNPRLGHFIKKEKIQWLSIGHKVQNWTLNCQKISLSTDSKQPLISLQTASVIGPHLRSCFGPMGQHLHLDPVNSNIFYEVFNTMKQLVEKFWWFGS